MSDIQAAHFARIEELAKEAEQSYFCVSSDDELPTFRKKTRKRAINANHRRS